MSYLTIEQVAEKLAVTPATMRYYAREGLIPAIKLAKSWRIPSAALDSVLHERAMGNLCRSTGEKALAITGVDSQSVVERFANRPTRTTGGRRKSTSTSAANGTGEPPV